VRLAQGLLLATLLGAGGARGRGPGSSKGSPRSRFGSAPPGAGDTVSIRLCVFKGPEPEDAARITAREELPEAHAVTDEPIEWVPGHGADR